MTEGGVEFGYKEGDTLLGHTDDPDDDGEQDAERTQPFHPGAWSTPYHGGETIEMQTWQHEQTGLPETSYGDTYRKVTDEEIQRRLDALRDKNTGLLNDSGIELLPPSLQQKEIESVKNFIRARYPEAKFGLGKNELRIEFSEEKGKRGVVVIGPNGGKTKIVLENGSDFHKAFLNKTFVKQALRDPAEKIISRNAEEIRKKQKEYEEMRNKREKAEKSLREQNELVMSLNERLNKEKAKIDQPKDLPEYEEEIRRKKELTNNLKKDLKEAVKERKEREKK